MATYVYIRVSTDHQDFLSQKNIVRDYMLRIGIDPTKVEATVTEKISGGKKADERELSRLFKACRKGDIIITSELSRFGRDALDVETSVRYCRDNGVSVHFIKEGIITSGDPTKYDLATELIIKIYASVAENFRHEVKFRINGAMAGIKAKFADGRKHRSKAGNIIDHLGNVKGVDLCKAQAASAKKRKEAVVAWRRSSEAYDWVCRKLAAGWKRAMIIDEFNDLHARHPKIYCTRGGGSLTEAVLSKWAKWFEEDRMAGMYGKK